MVKAGFQFLLPSSKEKYRSGIVGTVECCVWVAVMVKLLEKMVVKQEELNLGDSHFESNSATAHII